jgi:hypothetical protein
MTMDSVRRRSPASTLLRRSVANTLPLLVLMTPVVGGAAEARTADAAAAPAGARDFHADLAAEWQTRYTESAATGRADVHLDLATLTLSWTITWRDLSGAPRSLALHAPAQPGANGAKVLDLAPRGLRSPVRGSAVITAAQAQYLLYGWSYVNLASTRFPAGEIRGQLDVRPPATVTR